MCDLGKVSIGKACTSVTVNELLPRIVTAPSIERMSTHHYTTINLYWQTFNHFVDKTEGSNKDVRVPYDKATHYEIQLSTSPSFSEETTTRLNVTAKNHKQEKKPTKTKEETKEDGNDDLNEDGNEDLNEDLNEDFNDFFVLNVEVKDIREVVSYVRIRSVQNISTNVGEWSASSLPWRSTTALDCYFESQYLNASSLTPSLWKCAACPVGAWCEGSRTWDHVIAKQGYW